MPNVKYIPLSNRPTLAISTDSEFSIIKDAGNIAEMNCNDMTTVQQYYPDAIAKWTKNGEEFVLDGLRIRIDRKTLGKLCLVPTSFKYFFLSEDGKLQ